MTLFAQRAESLSNTQLKHIAHSAICAGPSPLNLSSESLSLSLLSSTNREEGLSNVKGQLATFCGLNIYNWGTF